MARKTPPFKFASRAAAHSNGKLRPGCRTVRTPTGTRFLCKTSSTPKRRKAKRKR